jgi:hypothetical protein
MARRCYMFVVLPTLSFLASRRQGGGRPQNIPSSHQQVNADCMVKYYPRMIFSWRRILVLQENSNRDQSTAWPSSEEQNQTRKRASKKEVRRGTLLLMILLHSGLEGIVIYLLLLHFLDLSTALLKSNILNRNSCPIPVVLFNPHRLLLLLLIQESTNIILTSGTKEVSL